MSPEYEHCTDEHVTEMSMSLKSSAEKTEHP